jgi:hypothetical protein
MALLSGHVALFVYRNRAERSAWSAVHMLRRAGAALLLPQIWPDILGRHALPAGRLARLGARLDFHHGLLSRFGRSTATLERPGPSWAMSLFCPFGCTT